jgi:FlaA1/EpsC-like NDP-sugar epimerase
VHRAARDVFHTQSQLVGGRRRILIYGAGRGGSVFLRETNQNPELGYQAVGFVDDRPDLWHDEVNGGPVLGGVEQLKDLIPQHRVQEVVVSSAKIAGEGLRMAADSCAACGVPLRRFRITVDHVPVEAENGSHSEARSSGGTERAATAQSK